MSSGDRIDAAPGDRQRAPQATPCDARRETDSAPSVEKMKTDSAYQSMDIGAAFPSGRRAGPERSILRASRGPREFREAAVCPWAPRARRRNGTLTIAVQDGGRARR